MEGIVCVVECKARNHLLSHVIGYGKHITCYDAGASVAATSAAGASSLAMYVSSSSSRYPGLPATHQCMHFHHTSHTARNAVQLRVELLLCGLVCCFAPPTTSTSTVTTTSLATTTTTPLAATSTCMDMTVMDVWMDGCDVPWGALVSRCTPRPRGPPRPRCTGADSVIT